MISIFGILSAVAAVVSIVALVLHFKLMQKRSAVDDALIKMDELMYLQDEENEETLEARSLEDATGAYNNAVNAYNDYISKFPGIVMALVVGFKKEKLMEL